MSERSLGAPSFARCALGCAAVRRGPSMLHCIVLAAKHTSAAAFASSSALTSRWTVRSLALRVLPRAQAAMIRHEPKCARPECNFERHPDPKNNGGTHCCRACKQNGGHGVKCAKIPYVEQEGFTVRSDDSATGQKKSWDDLFT